MEDKVNRLKFFKESFLVANAKFELILKMFFLKLSNIEVLFGEKVYIWKIYTINEALSTIEQILIIDKKNFIMVILDINNKRFIVHVAI